MNSLHEEPYANSEYSIIFPANALPYMCIQQCDKLNKPNRIREK